MHLESMGRHFVALLAVGAFGCGGDAKHEPEGGAESTMAPTAAAGCAASQPTSVEGLERCENSVVHRVRAVVCANAVPRSAAIDHYDPNYDECQTDSDCDAVRYGHCGLREGSSRVRTCVEGCVSDDDCDTGQLCLCGEPVGRCVPARCHADADCAGDYLCAQYSPHPGCFPSAFACQSALDGCRGDTGCDYLVNPTACVFNGEQFACTLDQCTTP